MVTTRSGKDSSESLPPYRKALKAEAKKKYETRGKQRREAVPEVPRRSARLSARQNAGLQPISTTPAPVPSTTTPTPTLNKRKRDVTEKDEVNVTKKQKLTLAKQSDAGKRKRAEEDGVVNTKKQKLTLAKQSDAGKRKRTDDDTLIEEKTSSREIKKGRTAAPKTEIVETEVKKKEKKPSKDRRTSATKAKDVEKEVKEKEEKTEVRQSTASNAMTADKEVKEKEEETGRDATTDSSRPVNKGNGKAREELTGELNLARHASTSSSRYDRSTMASTSRHTLDDTKSVDGDYNTDDDLDDDSGFYFYDSFQDSKHTSKPSSGKRSNSASKKTAASLKTSSTTVMKTTSTSDEDFEDTLRSDGVRREEAGRPVQEDQRRPAVILDTNYGNGVHGRLTIREPRPVRTAEEMANRTQQEIENDATLNWFWDLTDVRDRQAMALGSRGKGGPAPRRTIE